MTLPGKLDYIVNASVDYAELCGDILDYAAGHCLLKNSLFSDFPSLDKGNYRDLSTDDNAVLPS